jgi:hypothetical protein
MGLKRTDNPRELASAIEELEKRPQNRKAKRILTTLRAKLDRLVPNVPDPEAAQTTEVQT